MKATNSTAGSEYALAACLIQLNCDVAVLIGDLPMTRAKVTRILRIVFLLWLVVSLALVLTTSERRSVSPYSPALLIQRINRALF